MLNPTMAKEFLFKSSNSGTSRKSGKPYSMIELHDVASLENTNFFLEPDQSISTDGFRLKDKVEATLEMTIQNGRPGFKLVALTKK
ncbi:hypothetical protein [Paenibacillus amylolyticus]|uniref:hypothetical protein n=1 Tax=Paenibacillus amylolyticus TaxID=1451 RepID=UPI00201E40DB|nr:hypothetical protein [Paenibacillus amylolyticus]MCL6664554.1 hypothetical protein [Paenibacillus amylolyticus]